MKMVGRTHPGLQRMRNEDALRYDAENGVAVLADGLGGLMAGSEASKVAVEKICRHLELSAIGAANDLGAAIESAHQAILEISAAKEMASKMGSTVVIWMRTGDAWHGAWVGDSRLYHWHHQQLRQITKDHSLAQRMLDSGEAEPGVDVEAHYGHVLTQGLGLRQPLDPGYCSGGCESSGQRFLLCSDGLSDMVDDEKIAAALSCSDLDEVADRLIGDALDMGGRDNISLILIEP